MENTNYDQKEVNVAAEHLKCCWSELRLAISVTYTLNFRDLIQKYKTFHH